MKRGMVLSIITIVLAVAVNGFADRVIYVDVDAPGANDGSSWVNAYNFLQDALADAESVEKPAEIRVAQGVYKPDRSTAEPNGTGDRYATFHLINNVAIKGGFAGYGQADPNARDIEAYESVLSGDLVGNDVDVNDPCDLVDEPTRAENCYHVTTAEETDETAVIDGFTIRSGNANYQKTDPRHRYVHNDGSGLYILEGGVTILNCLFCYNSAIQDGGSILSSRGLLLIARKCNFFFNSAREGGALSCYGGKAKLHDCNIINNWSHTSGGALKINDVDIELLRCILENNTSNTGGGGGLCNYDGSTFLIDCEFLGNRALGHGGGMWVSSARHSSLKMRRCRFAYNLSNRGGAISLDQVSKISFESCIFTGNRAYECGGAFHGRTYDCAELIFKNCTFSGNVSSNGSAISQDGNPADQYESYELHNCIIWNGNEAIWNNSGTAININYSDLQSGAESLYDPHNGVILSGSNIDADPCFFDPGYWDPNGTPEDANDDFWVSGDYHLKSQAGRWNPSTQSWMQDNVTSLCIDAGDPLDAIGFEPFPNGGIINMGAYGGTSEASRSYLGEPVCETVVPGDINGDCRIDFLDVMLMTMHWLADNTPPLSAQATNPFPADGATDVNTNITLTWSPSAKTISYDIYFGPTSPGVFQGNRVKTRFAFNELILSEHKTYYWRIDSVGWYGKTTGQVWQFTTGKGGPR